MIDVLRINVEGMDSSGKSTVCRYLGELLRDSDIFGISKEDIYVKNIHQPDYDSSTGKNIRSLLKKHEPLEMADALAILYSTDREKTYLKLYEEFKDKDKKLFILISDRSYISNMMYQGMKSMYDEENRCLTRNRRGFNKFVDTYIEIDIKDSKNANLLFHDTNIYIRANTDEIINRLSMKKNKDNLEKDNHYIELVNQMYDNEFEFVVKRYSELSGTFDVSYGDYKENKIIRLTNDNSKKTAESLAYIIFNKSINNME